MIPSAATHQQGDAEATVSVREVRYEHSLNLAPLLEHLRVTLLVSTYQAGKLVVVGAKDGKPEFSFHSFERAMGVAVRPDRLAVGARTHIWLLRSAPDIAARLAERGHDACYLTRAAHYTGDVHILEMAWVGDELWFVNTLFSCVCTLHDNFSFVPRWKPPFITALAAEDRCHLNGLGPDGKHVACAGSDDESGGKTISNVRIWHVSDGIEEARASERDGCIYSVSFSPDGQRLDTAQAVARESSFAKLGSVPNSLILQQTTEPVH